MGRWAIPELDSYSEAPKPSQTSFMDRLKSTGVMAPAPVSSGTPWKPGYGQGLGVLAPPNNPWYAPNNVPQAAPANTGFAAGGGGMAAGGGGGIAGGGGGGPVNPPKPPPIDYSTYSEDALAGADSTFMDQRSMYAQALKNYLLDDERQRGVLKRDHDTAQEGIGRNRENGLTSLSADFSARGLGKSGLFTKALQEGEDQYSKQKETVTTGLKNSNDDLDFRQLKFKNDNTNNIKGARQEAIARLMAKQSLT
jgi:hypothetical protein